MSRFELYQAVVTDVVIAHNRCDIDLNGRGFFDVEVNPAYRPKAGDRCWVITRGSFDPWVVDKVRPSCRPVVSKAPYDPDRGYRNRWQWKCQHGAYLTAQWRDALADARQHARHELAHPGSLVRHTKAAEFAAIGWDLP